MSTTYVVVADGVHESAALCDYLDGRLSEADAIHAIDALPGDEGDDARDAADALNAVAARLGAVADVETHRSEPETAPGESALDLVERVDADEIVFGLGGRSSAGEIDDLGRSLLGETTVPAVAVPVGTVRR